MNESPLWEPGRERIEAAAVTRFAREVATRHAVEFPDYAALHRWSVDHAEDFWCELWRFCDVLAQDRGDTVLENPERMPGARWFPGARLNFAANLLRHRGERTAIAFRNEHGDCRRLTRDELYDRVRDLAAALRAAGIVPGDRIAGFLPNIPETVIAMLAATSIGATWTSCSPDFGVHGVLDRFSSVEPRVLFCADGYYYNGKRIDTLARTAEIVAGLPSVERTVVIPYVDPAPSIESIPGAMRIDDFAPAATGEIEFVDLPFDHPLYVMYSSGTTGKPKCIVHGAGGTLLQHLKELVLHTGLNENDTIFYYTTCGWMMWNWLVSSLATGATVVLWDGAPFAPGPAAMFDLIDAENIRVFGTSAKFIAAAEKAGLVPRETHNLGALRTILSTGSPLVPENFDYVYRHIHPDVCLSSISGGTDIISCFALGNPALPVWRGELQCRGLGMAVDVYNEDGRPVTGQKGELVCTRPFPSMPVGFWNDPDGSRFRAAYFERFPGVWAHGDYAELTAHGGLVIHGRSDAVLNPGGVRIGTAEIYRQVEKVDAVLESLVIGQRWDDDVRVVLFVRLREGLKLDDILCERIRAEIRANATPRHVPAKILQVTDIPRTISGKIVELAVRNVVHGEAVKNTDALANPEALEQFRDRPELRD